MSSARRAWCLLLACGSLVSCDPETEGCLDYRATSIDVTADLACDDCCTYPSLVLQWLPARFVADTITRLSRGTPAAFEGDTLRDLQLAFYLHDIALERADGTLYPLTDTLTVVGVVEGEDRARLQPSLLLAEPLRSPTNTYGALLEPFEAVALRATLGLPEELAAARPAIQPTTSALSGDRDSLLLPSSGGLATGALAGVWTATGDTLLLRVEEARVPMRYPFAAPVDITRSFRLIVSLALPTDALAELVARAGGGDAVDGEDFAEILLEETRVLEVATAR